MGRLGRIVNYHVLLVLVLGGHGIEGLGKGKARSYDEIVALIGGLPDIGDVHILGLCGYHIVGRSPLPGVLPGVAVELQNPPPGRGVKGFVVYPRGVGEQADRYPCRLLVCRWDSIAGA